MNFESIKQVLKEKCIGIAGAGGLGSNAAAALVRIGIGKIIIADFDVIEESNLNRQFYFHDQLGYYKAETIKRNLLRINPYINIETHCLKIGPENIVPIFGKCDVIIEAFDKAEMKKMLIEVYLSSMPHIPLIIGSGMAGFGRSNALKVHKEGNIYFCGDGISEISEDNPPLAPRVGIVANMQANVALSLLLGETENV